MHYQRTTGAAASGAITSSAYTMATSRLLGRTTAGTGTIEEIAVSSNLALSAGTLDLSATLTGVNSITSAAGQTLTFATADTNQNIILAPHGTGSVNFSVGATNPVRAANVSNYGLISFNNVLTFAGAIGIGGGASGDNNLYHFVPSTGQHELRINNAQTFVLTATTLTLATDLSLRWGGADAAITGNSAAQTVFIRAGASTMLGVYNSGILVGGDGVLGGGKVQAATHSIATTSTDSVTLFNRTDATAGVPVQMSGRLRFRGSAYNSTSTLNETHDFWLENLPATAAGTTSATLRFAHSRNSAAATYPMTLTSGALLTLLGPNGSITGGSSGSSTFGTYVVSATSGEIVWQSSTRVRAGTDGTLLLLNNAANDFSRLQFGGTTSSFPGLKRVTTELEARLADDSAYTYIKAKLRASDGTAGANFGPGAVTSLTVVDGVVTAVS